ncbi:Calx-beta domain-containing protein [Leifsonia sp. NPDC080035]|uniref:Calx-beta domain-containing protein n=1 Tax=Leifsonia sp. NPDC080035 TaxID=3143936 RepID=A0AAU7GFL1_9MICO
MIRPRASLRAACAIAAGLVASVSLAALGGMAAATAAPAPVSAPASPLTPFVDCVQDAPLGAVTARTVVLGYRSTADAAVELPAGGGRNDLSSAPADRGQPTAFLPGEHHGAWLLTVDAAAEPSLGWQLDGATVAIDGDAPSCTTATSVAVSAPATAAAGSTVPVSAAVTRALLAAPGDGTVEFSLDGRVVARVPVTAGTARADIPAPAAGAHTIAAAYAPADGSALRPASASARLTVVPAAGPLAIAADSVVGGSTSARVIVSRTSSAGAATVEFATTDGTARSGADYVRTVGTVALADGQTQAMVIVPLAVRKPGAPASTFFVVLRRASTDVSTAVAAVSLPAVPVARPPAPAAAAIGGGGGSLSAAAAGPSSALPEGDPTAAAPSAVGASQDLFWIVVAALLTGGGIAGVLGLLRAAGGRRGDL